MNKRLPHIHARMWPARFADPETNNAGNTEYQVCYLIGLAKLEEQTDKVRENTISTTHKASHTSSSSTLTEILQTFEGQIRGDKHYFDPSISWVEVSHVKQSELSNLELDDRQWETYMVGNSEDDSDDSEDTEDDDTLLDDMKEDLPRPKKSSASKVKSHTGHSGAKLRPATDILNRLRWDPNLDSADYMVGYEDRFLGTREIPLDKWKSEQTEEEFIPQHRIVYFKKRTDGVIIWDKEKRVDKIFGSGVGSGIEDGDRN